MSGYFPATQLRQLSHTAELQYHSSTAFNAISDVSAYSQVLPLVFSSNVTAKDAAGLPKTARLKVGYPAMVIEEEWPCNVKCDRKTGIVELRDTRKDEGQGVMEHWALKWHINPPLGTGGKKNCTVQLDIEIKFRAAMYDQMFGLLHINQAEKMLRAFEGRIEGVDVIERKERLQAIKAKAEAAKKARAKQAVSAHVALPKRMPDVAGATESPQPKPIVPAKAAPKKLEIRSMGKPAPVV